MLETLWTQLLFLSGVLGVFPKTLGCLFVLYAGYCYYMLCLWLGIPLYIVVTQPNFCEDLMHLKLGILNKFITFACLVSIQRMRILNWLIMSIVGFLLVRRFFSLAFTLYIGYSLHLSPFFNFQNFLIFFKIFFVYKIEPLS